MTPTTPQPPTRAERLLTIGAVVPAAEARVPGHLDLEDPLPRGPGAAAAAADAGRLPAVRRGGRRAAADDPAAAARRVPAAARHPPGARRAGARRSAQRRRPAGLGDARGRGRRSTSCASAPAIARELARELEEFGLLVARARPADAALPGDGRRRRDRVRAARALRDRAAAPARVPHRRRPRDRRCSSRRRARAARAEPRAPRRPGSRTCRRSRELAQELVAAPVLARSAAEAAVAGQTRDRPLDLAAHVRDVPDFPKPGIVFKDIMPLLANREAFHAAVEELAGVGRAAPAGHRARRRGARLHHRWRARVRLGAGFVAARKPGKLPWRTVSATYALEYGFDALELHADAIAHGRSACSSTTTCSRPAAPRPRSASRRAARRRGGRRALPHRARLPERPRAARRARRRSLIRSRELAVACGVRAADNNGRDAMFRCAEGPRTGSRAPPRGDERAAVRVPAPRPAPRCGASGRLPRRVRVRVRGHHAGLCRPTSWTGRRSAAGARRS